MSVEATPAVALFEELRRRLSETLGAMLALVPVDSEHEDELDRLIIEAETILEQMRRVAAPFIEEANRRTRNAQL